MIRKIIKIDKEKCSGCGACAAACHEGAIQMAEGKAVLTREDYCDGLGDCLPACPTNAISFEEREAPAYDQAAVLAAKAGTAENEKSKGPAVSVASRLRQWPVQIKLVPVNAPYFNNADLLVAADCTAYAYGNFHSDYLQGRTLLIGCPKLDQVDYAEKLTQILSGNEIKSVTVLRMEVPCCGGIENAVRRALEASGRSVPLEVVVISTDGKFLAKRFNAKIFSVPENNLAFSAK